jgi:DNA helicase-2/ATP-dependent DNA helicase PcrA
VHALSEAVGGTCRDIPRLARAVTQDAPHTALLADLTESQRHAVTHPGGPMLVLAGPGSGKTRVITRRIAHLIASGVPAWRILALTFTNKAAGAMRERVDSLVGEDVPGRRGLVVGTFHSFCAGLLRRYGPMSAAAGLGVPLDTSFSIIDSDDAHALLKRAIEELGLDRKSFPASVLSSRISAAKNRLLTAEEFAQEAADFQGRSDARIYRAYEALLQRQSALDFDDLLLRAARMLRDDPAVRADLQQRFQHVLVDEYQDTNHAQFMVAHAIASAHRNICVVGDPDQSIYGWRGADITNILEFEERFDGATVIPLGENFRSTGHIVHVADQLIRRNAARRHKDLSTQLDPGHRPRVVRCMDETHEAQVIADALQEAGDAGIVWSGMAVLYRMNALSRAVEDVLRRRGIPYVIARGTAFYERREVKDSLAYLRLVANPRDDLSLQRIINVPGRGIGQRSVEKVDSLAMRRGITMLEACADARAAGVASRTADAMASFAQMVGRFREELACKPAENLGPFVARLIEEAGMERAAQEIAGDDQDAQDRVANVQEVANAAADFALPEAEPGAPPATLGDALRGFLERVALVADADAVDPLRGAVTLMTLHAAKGLEFPFVAIAGLEEGLLPHARSIGEGSGAGVEEERRLLFVGITRAERSLLITSAATRAQRGVRMSTIESGFLRELPEDSVVRHDAAPGASPGPVRGEGGWGGGTWARGGWRPASRDSGEWSGRWGWKRAAPDPADAVDEIPPDDTHIASDHTDADRIEADEDAFFADGSPRPRRDLRKVPAQGTPCRAPASGIVAGTVVRHAQFGIGTVESVERYGSATRARVAFRHAGIRTLILEHAKLEIVA